MRPELRTYHEGTVTITDTEFDFYRGDDTWHDGPGWYYVLVDYPDEGSCGAFDTYEEAYSHAKESLEG